MVLVFAAVSAFSAHIQTATTQPFGAKYLEMARQYRAGARIVHAPAPWVFRIATPWLASFASPSDEATPFYVINITSALTATILLWVWLRRFVGSFVVQLLLVSSFIAVWVGPARFVYFTPAYVDPLFIVFMLAGILFVDATRDHPPGRGAGLLAILVFLGTLSRESMGIVALAFAVAHGPFAALRMGRLRDAFWASLPLAAALAALVFISRVAIPSEPYTLSSMPLKVIREKPLYTSALSWFFAFGPAVVALVAADGSGAFEFLRGEPHLAVYLAGCVLLSYFGGVDDERVSLWAAPVVYVLAGHAIGRYKHALRSVLLVTVLAVAQIVSARLLWPIPVQGTDVAPLSGTGSIRDWVFDLLNRLIVVDTHYGNLWSFWGSRRLHLVLFAYDVAFVLLIVTWMRVLERHACTGDVPLDVIRT